MNRFRSIIVAASAASLLGLPLVASAATPTSTAQTSQAAARYNTTIRFLDFDHTRGYGRSFHVRGQVAVPSLGGAVKGVRVKLYRTFNGSSHWSYLATKYTSQTSHPRFRFLTAARGNARYRVVFAGNTRLQPSRNSTAVSVYRHFDAKLDSGTGRFHGRITPHYAHRIVSLDTRACAGCGWHRLRSHRTRAHGRFHFKVNAPSHGAYYWRTSTPETKRFIQSYSAVFTTRLG